MKTKVIFRIWPKSKGGEAIALFPRQSGTANPHTCLSYQHTGQHGAASLDLFGALKLAKPAEFRELSKELRRIGYTLDIRKRATRSDLKKRLEQIHPAVNFN